jgi:hypothetical protein
LFAGLLRLAVWQNFSDVSHVVTASIIMTIIVLMMEAASTPETLVDL